MDVSGTSQQRTMASFWNDVLQRHGGARLSMPSHKSYTDHNSYRTPFQDSMASYSGVGEVPTSVRSVDNSFAASRSMLARQQPGIIPPDADTMHRVDGTAPASHTGATHDLLSNQRDYSTMPMTKQHESPDEQARLHARQLADKVYK